MTHPFDDRERDAFDEGECPKCSAPRSECACGELDLEPFLEPLPMLVVCEACGTQLDEGETNRLGEPSVILCADCFGEGDEYEPLPDTERAPAAEVA